MTLKEAIAEETRRYIAACGMASDPVVSSLGMRPLWTRRAHIRYRALCRLRHAELSEHESLKFSVGT